MTEQRKTWTRLQLIEWTADYFSGKGIESARLDAEVLLGHVLRASRIDLYVHYDRQVEPGELARFRELVARRAAREPLKYILGNTEFFSLPFLIDHRVLIPRPETELMTERAIELLSRELPAGEKLVVDVGTGSGCIAIAVAKNLPDVTVHATDSSEGALELARKNAEELAVQDQIEFHAGELLEPVRDLVGRVHLLISNPPYVAEGEFEDLAPDLKYEPRDALVAGPTGLEVIEKLLESVPAMLAAGGVFLCEMGAGQAADVQALARGTGFFETVTVRRDYADIERILEARAPGEKA